MGIRHDHMAVGVGTVDSAGYDAGYLDHMTIYGYNAWSCDHIWVYYMDSAGYDAG